MSTGFAAQAARRQQRQRRYDQIMGDRPPKLTDREFVRDLTAKLDSYYLSDQSSKERQLADAEKRRQMRLASAALHDGVETGGAALMTKRGQKKRQRRSKWKSSPAAGRKKLPMNDGKAVEIEDDGDLYWREFWPPNPSKPLSESRREAREYRRKINEAQQLAQLLQSLPPVQNQPDAAIGSALNDADSDTVSCHCDDSNRDFKARLSCDMTVDQLYKRASSLRTSC